MNNRNTKLNCQTTNTVKLNECYPLQQLMAIEQFATYKALDLIEYLVRKGCVKVVLNGVFNGRIVFRKSEVDRLIADR